MKRHLVLVGLIAGAVVVTAAAVNASSTYIGAQKCKMCHRLQYESWAETPHAKATEVAQNATDRKFEAACLDCHATNKDAAMAGVQCEACHGPGSEYKSLSIMKDKDKAIAAGLILPTQETCNKCHDGADHHKKVTFTKNVHAHKTQM
jgi:hypothetical protein